VVDDTGDEGESAAGGSVGVAVDGGEDGGLAPDAPMPLEAVAGLSPRLRERLAKEGITTLFRVQHVTLAQVLEGKVCLCVLCWFGVLYWCAP